MKAEELFLKIGNEFFNEILTLEEFSKEPDFNIIPKAMREYARIQIVKDRERIKANTESESRYDVYKAIGITPIILD